MSLIDTNVGTMGVADSIANFKRLINQAVEDQDYALAAKLRNQMNELIKHQQEDVVNMQRAQYDDEVRRIEQQYELELERFNRTWEERLIAFENKARAKRDELEIEYSYELKNGEANYQRQPVKFSTALLNLREKQIAAGRIGNFEEAIVLKREADALEAEEIKAHEKYQNYMEAQGSEPIHKKFELKKQSLEQRIEAGKTDIMNRWAADMDALQRHFETMKRHEANKIFTALNGRSKASLEDSKGSTQQLRQTIRTAKSPVATYISRSQTNVSSGTLTSGRAPSRKTGRVASRGAGMTASLSGPPVRSSSRTGNLSSSMVGRMHLSKNAVSPVATTRARANPTQSTPGTPGRIPGVSPAKFCLASP